MLQIQQIQECIKSTLYFNSRDISYTHMSFSSQHNRAINQRFRIGLLLLLICLFIFQTQSIKLFGKKTEQKPKQTSDVDAVPKGQEQVDKQVKPSKTTDQPKIQQAKPVQSTQKPVQSKPEISTPSVTPKPQQKPQPKASSDKSLDGLFGQSTPKKPSQVPSSPTAAPAMTVKAEQHKNDATSVTSSASATVATSPQPEQKAKQTTNTIAGLFDDQKNGKPQKNQVSKENKPKAESEPKPQQKPKASQQSSDSKAQKTQSDQKQPDNNKGKSQDKGQKSSSVAKQEDTEQDSEKVEKPHEDQKKQEQSSGDVYYPASKKDPKKQQTKTETKPKEEKKKAEVDSTTEQDEKAEQQSQKSTPKSKQTDSQQSQSEQVIYPKKSAKKSKTDMTVSTQQNTEQAKQKYSLTLFMTFCLYSFIIILVVITIKCTSSSSKLVRSVEIMVGALWNMFLIKKGYRKMAIEDHDDQVTQKQEEITVGYNVQDNNKQIFWEKNSVEGI